MRLGEDTRCQLLLAVYPAFVEALPSVSTPQHNTSGLIPPGGLTPSAATLSRDNYITELRDEFRKIGLTFSLEDALSCDLTGESLLNTRNALDQLLFHLEDLIQTHHEVMQYAAHGSMASVRHLSL